MFLKSFCLKHLHILFRILLIQNAPEKIPIGGGSPPVRVKRRERSARGQVVANIEPPPPPAAYHEEDESGGFETYRGNPHRRLSALADERRASPDERRASDTRLQPPDEVSAR